MNISASIRACLDAIPVGMAGEEVVLDCCGTAYFPGHRLLVVADLHLEKSAAFARRGSLLPPYDSIATLARLALAIERYAPRAVACLGDSFHEADSHVRLDAQVRARLAELGAGRDWIWIEGNHDPHPPAGLGGIAAAELHIGGIGLRHQPRGGGAEIAGHLHPAARVRVRGRSLRRRCFAFDGTRLILPAFGALTGSINLRSAAFDGLFDARSLCAYLLGDGALHAIPHRALLPG